jgi:Activator of Hsp90 ATPase homolog 1-like protein
MDAIHHEVWIDAERPVVFEAITTRAGLDAWWGKALVAEPEVGSVVEFDHGLGAPLRMGIADVAVPERLTWRCISEFGDAGMPGSEWLGHCLTFELAVGGEDPSAGWLRDRLGLCENFTILRFRHSGWEPDSRWRAFCNSAWGVTLDGLKRHCETLGEQR